MSAWVTIAIIDNYQEAELAKWKLESYGFVVNLLDTYNATNYSKAVSGVKFQVLEKDAIRARKYLEVSGFVSELKVENDGVVLLEKWTAKIPVVGKITFGKRVLIMFLLLLFTAVIITFLFG